MKRVALLLCGFAFLPVCLRAAEPPEGTLIEVHSCRLYAGGCLISSEATQGGRYLLRVWDFKAGEFAGTRLAGLQVALLQASPENLAATGSDPGQGVAYLPESATAGQRQTLLAWVKSAQPGLQLVSTRAVPFHLAKTEAGYSFSAGKFVSVSTAPFDACDAGACGDALWYTPQTPTSYFTVVVDRSSRVQEPLLQLKWNDAGKRSVFLARFGEPTPAKGLYVNGSELCGPTAKVF